MCFMDGSNKRSEQMVTVTFIRHFWYDLKRTCTCENPTLEDQTVVAFTQCPTSHEEVFCQQGGMSWRIRSGVVQKTMISKGIPKGTYSSCSCLGKSNVPT